MVHNYSSWGGNLATVLALARGLPAFGFDVALAAPRSQPYAARFAAAGVAVHDVEIRRKADVAAVRRYRALVRAERFDVVHTHTRRADFAAAYAARTSRPRPVVVSTQHGQINLERGTLRVKRDLPARFYGWCLRTLFDRNVAVSDEIAAELRERCGVKPGRITRIPNGIDAAPFLAAATERNAFRRELGVPRWAVVATIVASLDVKGHLELLAAAAGLIREGLDIRVVAAGEGRDGRPQIEARARELGITDRVHLLGFRGDVPRVLAGSDIFVLPTRSEGLSIAIMEAMAAGLPVVATNVGGNAELVTEGRTGYVVAAGDATALAAALGALAREPEKRHEFGSAGRARVTLEFTADKMTARYAALYRELLAARGAGS